MRSDRTDRRGPAVVHNTGSGRAVLPGGDKRPGFVDARLLVLVLEVRHRKTSYRDF